MTGLFLAGTLRPAGLAISFLQRPLGDVRAMILDWRRGLGQQVEVIEPLALPSCVAQLEPYEAPWTTELLIDCGTWTAYMNNFLGGGDPTAAAPFLGTALGCELAVAVHVPSYGPGHAATRLELSGPDGVPPLMVKRVLSAHAEDGRWSWSARGVEQPFEKPERYTARKIRDRLDRALLVEYLGALGIRADDPGFYGSAVAIRQIVTYERRQESAAQERARFGW